MYIREFCWPEDYPAVVALWQTAGLYNPAADGPLEIQSVAQRNPGLFLLAEEPGVGIVGSIIGAFDGRRGYIYHVGIHPDYHRKGYGTDLMREVEKRLWALGARKIRFMVKKENTAAQEFYRTLGFDYDDFAVSMSKSRPLE